MVIWMLRVADWPAVSVTRAVNVDVPAVVGVPAIAPFDARLSPAGGEPADTLHVYGGVPPAAPTLAEYGCPTVPGGMTVSVDVTGGGAAGLIVICRSRVAD